MKITSLNPEKSFTGSHSLAVCKLERNYDEEVLIIRYTGKITRMQLEYSIAGGLCTSKYCGLILDIREAELELTGKSVANFMSFIYHSLEPITKLVKGNFKFLIGLKHRDWFEHDNALYWIPNLKEAFTYSEEEAIDSISSYWESLGEEYIERLIAHQPLIKN